MGNRTMKTHWVMHVYFRDGSAKWQGTMSGKIQRETAKKLLLKHFKEQYRREERRARGGAEYILFLGQEGRSDYSQTRDWDFIRRTLSRLR